MKAIGALLLGFLIIGLFARKYNLWTQLALLTVILTVVFYMTFV